MARITLSFKNTSKDMALYKEIKSMEEQSEFIKTAIRYYIEKLKKKNST